MSDVKTLDNELNQAVLSGQIMDAFEKYYADDVVMQENSDQPSVGKDANRKREQEFVGSVAEIHSATVDNTAVQEDVSFSQWSMDLTFKNGYRAAMNQVAVRRWKDGKIVHERFFYNKG